MLEEKRAAIEAGVEQGGPVDFEPAFRAARGFEHVQVVSAARAFEVEVNLGPVGSVSDEELGGGWSVGSW